MNWYLAKIVYRIVCGDGAHTAQFNEQLRLIASSDYSEALYKAKELGEAEADHFYNNKMQLVRWQFVNVSELYLISNMLHGAELYSSINEVDNAEAYTNFVHDKAVMLQTHHQTKQILNLA